MQEHAGPDTFDVFPYIVRLIFRTVSGMFPTRVNVQEDFILSPSRDDSSEFIFGASD